MSRIRTKRKFLKIVRRMGRETEIGERETEHLGKWNPIKAHVVPYTGGELTAPPV